MKFVMPFTGSRGDVQPGLVLASELSARGHEVTFGAPPNLVAFAEAATAGRTSVSVVPFGPDTRALLESDLVRTRIKSKNLRTRWATLAELANFGWDDMAESVLSMGAHADMAIAGTLGQELVFNYAESQSIPFAALHYCPIRSNRSMSVVPSRTMPGVVNRATWRILESMRWSSMKKRENAQRRALGLENASRPLPGRIASYGGIEIQAYDSAFFPGLRQEWADRRPFVGFLEPDGGESSGSTGVLGSGSILGSPLRSWIESGTAPVYFGFGSMPVKDPTGLVSMIEDVCARGGYRAVVSSGWSTLDERIDADSSVAVVGSVDHGALFPLCRAAVHHGGAGTTAASVRAGLPTMVCWFSADQPFWGAALERTGAGCSAKFVELDRDILAAGIETLMRPDTASRARQLAAAMTSSADTRRAAVRLIEGAVHQNS
ncbi:hypothetical protein CH267_01350 [Rhodococcus sp. 06-621-2]|nr:nucleotide disphospho-sugar-binding domain-containing protein [Rhodococcus sp. 06-621-2]OZC62215.1 hypothetical protein CH267_01350 [Rhodococcus sp. 06-621-2]